MKATRLLLLGLLLITTLPVQASVAEPQSAWKKKSIRVCWGTADNISMADLPRLSQMLIEHSEFEPLSPQDKQQVKETITREYNLERIGIDIVGWENCTPTDTSDAVIFTEDLTKPPKHMTDLFFAPSYQGCSSLGDESPGSSLKRFVHIKKVSDYDLKVSSLQALNLIAIHEFGHLMGLRHEHARKFEAGNDPNCFTMGIALLETVGSTAKTFGNYDPNSIMNYCFDFTIMNKTGTGFYIQGLSKQNLRTEVVNSNFDETDSLEEFNSNQVNFTDPTLFTQTPNLSMNAVQYQVRIGLSENDIHTLKCLYDEPYKKTNCASEK